MQKMPALRDEFSKSLPDRLEAIIKERILTARIPMGSKIGIQELSNEFNISSTPVRDTLNRLAAQGLVIINPRVGYYVRQYTKKEAGDLFYLRSILETGALKLAMDKITDEDIARFRSMNNLYMEKPVDEKYLYRFCTDDTIHAQIIRKSENEKLLEVYLKIYDQITVLLHVYPHDPKVLIDHRDMIEAIASGDIEVAIRALESHIAMSLGNIVPYLQG